MSTIQQDNLKIIRPVEEMLLMPVQRVGEVFAQEQVVTEYTRNQMRDLTGFFSAIPKCLRSVPCKGISSDHVYKSIVKRSGHGCTGFTFIFAMTPSAISGTFINDVRKINSVAAEKIEGIKEFSFCKQNIKLVLKWALKEDQIIQSLYNNIYRHFGFLAPYSLPIADKESPIIQRICNVAYDNKLSLSATMSLTSTIGFRAANLDEARKGKVFAEYSMQDWREFFLFLGKLTVVDMLLGNHDRILRYNSSTGELDLQWNYANIMVDPRTKQYFTIDNGIDGGLLPKEKVEDYPTKVPSFDEEESVDAESPVEEKEESPVAEEKAPTCINQYFNFFLEKTRNEVEFEELSKKIVTSFFKDDEMAYVNRDEIFSSCMQGLRYGITEIVENIRARPADFKEVVTAFFQSKQEGDVAFRCKLLDVILKNISSISSI